MAQLSCRNLTLGYDGVSVVSGINFEVNAGDYLCIVGENGAGKSTLMKTLLHLLPPLGGEMVYGDGMKPYEIGYLPQQTVVQRDFPASVWEVVLSGTLSKCGRRPFYSRRERSQAEENLKRMGMWDLRRRCYRSLSGGQQQRVLLARALCAAKSVLLLDEPVTGLDPRVTADFYREIQELNREGVTILMITHDVTAALEHASHILQVDRSGCCFAPVEEYRRSEAVRRLAGNGGETHG